MVSRGEKREKKRERERQREKKREQTPLIMDSMFCLQGLSAAGLQFLNRQIV
jgi:hypothetical protein